MKPIDPSSPVPLYHQIAEAIRRQIEAGELAPGEALQPLRQAAEVWKVNLHTVRHAYAALARDGLVASQRGPRGTRVVGPQGLASPRARDDIAGMVARVAAEAERLHGATPGQLAAAFQQLAESREAAAQPRVWIVECSEWQCRCHAEEITRLYDVDARPWPLARGEEPPAGTLLSTYFHYNDIRRHWPTRLAAVRFLAIHPDPELVQRIGKANRILVAERDRSTAEVVCADLVALLEGRPVTLEPIVTDDPASCLEDPADAPVLFSPRVWAALSETVRRRPRAIELRYVFDQAELTDLARALAWQSLAAARVASSAAR